MHVVSTHFAKRWHWNVNITSYCDVTNSVYPVTMTTIRHRSILEFGRGGIQSSGHPGHHQTYARHCHQATHVLHLVCNCLWVFGYFFLCFALCLQLFFWYHVVLMPRDFISACLHSSTRTGFNDFPIFSWAPLVFTSVLISVYDLLVITADRVDLFQLFYSCLEI